MPSAANAARAVVVDRYGKLEHGEHWRAVQALLAERRKRIVRLREAGWVNRDIGRELALTDRQIRYAMRYGHGR